MVTLFGGDFAVRIVKAKTFGVREATLLRGRSFAFLLFRLGTFAG